MNFNKTTTIILAVIFVVIIAGFFTFRYINEKNIPDSSKDIKTSLENIPQEDLENPNLCKDFDTDEQVSQCYFTYLGYKIANIREETQDIEKRTALINDEIRSVCNALENNKVATENCNKIIVQMEKDDLMKKVEKLDEVKEATKNKQDIASSSYELPCNYLNISDCNGETLYGFRFFDQNTNQVFIEIFTDKEGNVQLIR